jgi:hypothetical protein
LRNRKNADLTKKICLNCNKEFNEGDNNNWSFWTHRSEWSGRMWWCCGKTKETAPGCLFRKNVSKEEDAEDGSDGEVKHKR